MQSNLIHGGPFMLRYVLAAAAVSLISSAGSAQVVNGGFEAPVITDPCCNTAPPASNLPGWTVTPDVNVVNGTFMSTAPGGANLAFEGSQYLDLVGQSGAGSISQDIMTTGDLLYNLSFAYSHNLFTGVPSASANVLINGVVVATITHTGGTSADLAWQPFSLGFTATGPTTTIGFVNLTGGQNEGVFLDAVSVAAVPEPATWAMMLIGLGAVGVSMRRRRKQAVPSQLA